MNEQSEGLGSSTPSNVPMKRKRGRPRKVDSGVQRTNMPAMPNSNQTVGTCDDCVDGMLGKEVACVIEGTFNGGYLVNVQVAADTYLRGVVFLPEQVVPVTAETDVAPQVRMIERTEIPIPIPVLNPETQIHPSVKQEETLHEDYADGGATKDSQQTSQPNNLIPPVQNTEKELATGQHSTPSVYKLNELIPDEPKPSIIETNQIPISTKDSQKTSEAINLVSTVENTQKDLTTGQHSIPSVYKQNELIPDEPKPSIIEINQIPVSTKDSQKTSEPIHLIPSFGNIEKGPTTGQQYMPSMYKLNELIPDEPKSTKDSQKTSEPINLVPTFGNIEKGPTTGQQYMPSMYKLNELIPDEPKSTKDSQKTSEPINLVPTFGNIEKGPTTGQQYMPSMYKLNELIPDEPKSTKDSQKTSEPINLVPTFGNIEKGPTTGQQYMPSMYKLNELIPDEPKSTKDSQKTSEPINLVPTFGNIEKGPTTGQQYMPSMYKLNEFIPGEPKPTKDSQKTSESINLVSTFENIEKVPTSGQQYMSSMYKLNELIPEESNCSNTEINQIPVSAEHESMPPEQMKNTVDNIMQKQGSPETGTQEGTKTKLLIETMTKVDTSNSNGRPSTGIANILDVGSNHALEFSHPPILFGRETVPSESKLLSEGSNFQEMRDPQNCGSFGAVNNLDANQPTQVLVTSLESENPIGSDAS
ncbi:uncharacterized protein LOC109793015 [Cajanus cajan]|uniref:Uncharacterized protein n=1 Tax=Cajanus cajan TaxID=3821 RepID=A0A151U0Q9_CAJCA|nr:uncharacterized protein LOC109793015 [Cajanus cajan]XP_020208088.1 uncharacterized protein LOC109793015 [Cajanus cajan]XP_029130452.1 uncharacterized protein LOC109793015 [Cajanus cajan]XP_029130455.1 uncharacterized protein LOC109793015 [Cajanus cajan]XP_029130462.1 uncharacterized protein LOC109793015 [Cajanus cajan]XP_029130468.1 uncharacterized protein LOC109793015 [Cajanus cajan]XP_029130471.1 uncharacterized protein LOC109793015 [Cajanus cajan]KYP72865.1 hypothetical protein KK1_005